MSKRDRKQRLYSAAEEGRRLSVFLDDPAIMALFEELEANAIEAMIAASASQDRDREALRIQVIRDFRSALQNIAKAGQRAETKIDQQQVTHVS